MKVILMGGKIYKHAYTICITVLVAKFPITLTSLVLKTSVLYQLKRYGELDMPPRCNLEVRIESLKSFDRSLVSYRKTCHIPVMFSSELVSKVILP